MVRVFLHWLVALLILGLVLGVIAIVWGTVDQLSPRRLVSEADLPAEPNVWSGCCSHLDCQEARIATFEDADPEKAIVVIDHYDPFPLERSKIHASKNEKAYYCRRNLNHPPDSENTRCVFLGTPRYVQEKIHFFLRVKVLPVMAPTPSDEAKY